MISKLKQIKKWTRGEKIQLQEIAKTNNQVSYIIDDDDVADFINRFQQIDKKEYLEVIAGMRIWMSFFSG